MNHCLHAANRTFCRRTVFLVIAAITFCSSIVSAQTTGKIAGQIIDAKSGDPMIGTNVYLEEISVGAATDVDGYYIIINVPPGTYTLVAEQIGFKRTRVTEVVCRVNFTTSVNVQMQEEVVAGEEVVVIAERPLIEKDLTGSKEVVTSDEIEIMPVTSVDQVVNLQGGVVNGRFRGGRSNEVLYMVDGVPVNSPSGGGRGINVGIEAVENLEVISGTFNAEYGRAMSGVVNVVTKKGSEDFHGNIEVYGGNYFSSAQLLGNDLYPENNSVSFSGIYDVRGSIEGPIPFTGKKLSFIVSGGRAENDGYLTGNASNLFAPETIHDPIEALFGNFNETGTGEVATRNGWRAHDLMAKVHWPISAKTNVSYSYLLNHFDSDVYDGFRRYVPDGVATPEGDNINHIFSVNQVFSDKAFADFRFAYLDESFEQSLDSDPLSDAYLPGAYSQSDLVGNNLALGGTDLSITNANATTLTIKGDLTWQLHRQHEIKTGYEFQQYNVQADNRVVLFADSLAFEQEQSLGLVDDFRPREISNNLVNTDFQYYHNSLAGDRNPLDQDARQAAFYIQDKMEFSKVVVNAGLRFDYFDSQGGVPGDLTDPNGELAYPDLSREEALERTLVDADPQTQISPRFGLAYQVTSEGVVHFSYGHFFQIPPLGNLYANPKFLILPGIVSSQILGNAGLEAQRTVSYELAYRDLITENIAGELTIYYRDIYDLLGTEILETANGNRYARFTNVDYGNVKGFIATLDVRMGDFTSTVDYTFQVAEGNASDPAAAFVAASAGRDPNLEAIRLDWDQRHTINASVNFSRDKVAFGLIGRFGSGNPFDYSPLPAPGRPILTFTENNGQMPTNFTVDLNASYNLGELSGLETIVYLQGYNILDNQNPNWVFGDSGSPSSTGTLAQNYFNLSRATFTTPEEIVFDGTSFAAPRELRLGLGLKF